MGNIREEPLPDILDKIATGHICGVECGECFMLSRKWREKYIDPIAQEALPVSYQRLQ